MQCARFISLFPFSPEPFGYYYTATFLRIDGILIGFLLAYIFVYSQEVWLVLRKLAFSSFILTGSLSIFLYSTSEIYPGLDYYFRHLVISLFFGTFLILIVNQNAILKILEKPVSLIALISYSIYLTHTFVIEASLRIATQILSLDNILMATLSLILCYVSIFAVGLIFYIGIEKVSLNLRQTLLNRMI